MQRATPFAALVCAAVLMLLFATLRGTDAGPGPPGPGRPVPQTPFTATLWTPPLSGEAFFCHAANISAAATTVKIEIVINQGLVVASGNETIPPDAVSFATFQPGAPSVCYCRISLTGNPDDVRGSLQAFEGTERRATAAVHAR